MNILVFGSTGFIGRNLLRSLVGGSHELSLYNRSHCGALPLGVTEYVGSYEDLERIRPLMESADVLIYLAWSGYPAVEGFNASPPQRGNVETATSILNILRGRTRTRILFVSSGGTVYGEPRYQPIDERHPTNPISAYGQDKLAVETFLLSDLPGPRIVILRPSTVFGPGQIPGRGQGLITTAFDLLLHDQPIDVWGTGHEIRDYLFVDDLVSAVQRTMAAETVPQILNIGSGAGVSVVDVLNRLARVSGRPLRIIHHPPRPSSVNANVLDSGLAAGSIGWNARVSFDGGLARTWEWIKSRPL